MKQLYFVRHGESEYNVQRRYAGRANTQLAPKGIAQGKAAGEAAKGLGIDHIISSPLTRAHDTATYIADAIGFPKAQIELNSLLMEHSYGGMEGQSWDIDLDLDGFTDIETVDSVLERATLALEHIRNIEADIVLVVAHGSFGKALWQIIHPSDGFDIEGPEGEFKNAKIVKFI